MKSAFAALLLLLQLQPVLGAATCLGLFEQQAKASCEMPEHGTMPSQNVSESVPLSTQSCALASVCTPAPLAIPCLPSQDESTVQLHAALTLAGLDVPVDVFSSPPFHPPRA
jgi:hypothetical protein